MKLTVDVLRYLSKDDFRVLTAVEMGMRNHEIVPSELIDRIAALKHGGTYKVLKNLLKHKLLHHDASKYDGFRLTYLGYDYLAIKTLVNRGIFTAVGRQIGVGKESDIFEVATEDGTILAMKLHRLGRVSFRAVKSKRDYLKHRSSFNWLYLSRLAALKEFAFMKALQEHGFPVPNAVDCNRHCVIMSLIQGYPLVQVKQLQNPDTVFETIIGLIIRLAQHGLIHCDFNEFNIMIDDDEKVTVIDFPQMVSVTHRNAQMYFDRDVECIYKFFTRRYNLSLKEKTESDDDSDEESDEANRPRFSSISTVSGFLDKELSASGFTRKNQEEIERFIEGDEEDEDEDEEEEDEDEEDTVADDEGIEDKQLTEPSVQDFDSRCSLKEQDKAVTISKKVEVDVDQECSQAKGIHGNETEETCDQEEEGEKSEEDNDDGELEKKLSKQRKRAIKAAHSGGRKNFSTSTSRNVYKDKGGRSSNSKLHKQVNSIW